MKESILILSLIGVLTISPGIVFASSHMEGSANTHQLTHLSFKTTQDALVDYKVDGQTVFSSISVGSKSETESRSGGTIGVGMDLGSITNIVKSSVSIQSKTNTNAILTTESGAHIKAHDNTHGILVVTPGEDSQIASINVSSSTTVQKENNKKVIITKENGDQGIFLVVGDGQATVNNNGNITADLASNSKLVFRDYNGKRDRQDKQKEQLITNQQAAAEVYIDHTNDQYRSDIVQYSDDTKIEVKKKTSGQINMTADRTQSQGKIILTSVSQQAIDATNQIDVIVDGELATQAQSYNELQTAIKQGSNSKYLVRQKSDTKATTDVAIAVNHFSTRQITIEEQDHQEQNNQQDVTQGETQDEMDQQGEGQNDSQDRQNQDSQNEESQNQSGFGILAGIVALTISLFFIDIMRR